MELGLGKRRMFCRSLNFNNAARAGKNEIGIDFGRGIFCIIKIEHWLPR